MLLKTCPICLGDMTMEGIAQEVGGRCIMCGYRLPVEAPSTGPDRDYSLGTMTTAQREWPYPRRLVRSSRL